MLLGMVSGSGLRTCESQALALAWSAAGSPAEPGEGASSRVSFTGD